jgi:hypothetical protein
LDVHCIVDNFATHNHPKIKAWLATLARHSAALPPMEVHRFAGERVRDRFEGRARTADTMKDQYLVSATAVIGAPNLNGAS